MTKDSSNCKLSRTVSIYGMRPSEWIEGIEKDIKNLCEAIRIVFTPILTIESAQSKEEELKEFLTKCAKIQTSLKYDKDFDGRRKYRKKIPPLLLAIHALIPSINKSKKDILDIKSALTPDHINSILRCWMYIRRTDLILRLNGKTGFLGLDKNAFTREEIELLSGKRKSTIYNVKKNDDNASNEGQIEPSSDSPKKYEKLIVKSADLKKWLNNNVKIDVILDKHDS